MIICTNPAKKRNKEIIKDNNLNIQQLYKLIFQFSCTNHSTSNYRQHLTIYFKEKRPL